MTTPRISGINIWGLERERVIYVIKPKGGPGSAGGQYRMGIQEEGAIGVSESGIEKKRGKIQVGRSLGAKLEL